MKADMAQELPPELRQSFAGLPDVLLRYQQELMRTTALHQVTICEKSRRIGMTWAVGADAVLTAGAARSAGGMDVLYIGYNLDMAREFIDVCAMWAKAFLPAAAEVEELLFQDVDEATGESRYVTAFKISFASGYEIMALTSKPRSLRGRQGYLILDESAFHDDLPGMMKAGMAFLMWGGKILVISTHNGETHPFNQLVQDARADRTPYAVVRVTFDDAIEDGLYERVAMMMKARGQAIAPKEKWIADIRAFYGRDQGEELDVIPAQGAGAVLSGALIEARMQPDIPVLRYDRPKSFSEEAPHLRQADAAEWCERHLEPLLRDLDPKLLSYFGMDFGRSADASVIWPIQVLQSLVRRPPLVVELWDIPFDQQKQILFYIVRRLPRFVKGAIDSGGNGAYIGETAADEFGHGRIEQVKLSQDWYLTNMPPFVDAVEDGILHMPRDADILGDHRLLTRDKGIIKVPDVRTTDTQSKGRKRHGDSAIAHALSHYASRSKQGAFEFHSAGEARVSRQPADDYFSIGGGSGGFGGRADDFFRM